MTTDEQHEYLDSKTSNKGLLLYHSQYISMRRIIALAKGNGRAHTFPLHTTPALPVATLTACAALHTHTHTCIDVPTIFLGSTMQLPLPFVPCCLLYVRPEASGSLLALCPCHSCTGHYAWSTSTVHQLAGSSIPHEAYVNWAHEVSYFLSHYLKKLLFKLHRGSKRSSQTFLA